MLAELYYYKILNIRAELPLIEGYIWNEKILDILLFINECAESTH